MSEINDSRKSIQEERMRLGAAIAMLEAKCPHEVYEIEKEQTDYDWRSEVWYNCFCHDCYKQWTVYEDSSTFKQVKEKYENESSKL